MGILDTAKEAVNLVQKIDNIELYRQILNLQAEVLKVVEENTNLKNQVKILEEKIKTKEVLTFENNGYWIKREDLKEGPYCTHCWDKEHTLVRMHLDETERWYCITHGKPRHPVYIA